jgi:hypothetical protein
VKPARIKNESFMVDRLTMWQTIGLLKSRF